MKRALLRNIFQDEHRANEKKFKFIEERVAIVEKHVPDLKNKISDYASKGNRSRKSLRDVSTILHNFGSSETVSQCFSKNLEKLSELLADVNAHKEVLSNALEANISNGLGEFGKQCKHMRTDLKAALSAAGKEAIAKRQLQRLDMLRDQSAERLSAAEADVLKTKTESAKAVHALGEHADIFEQRRLVRLRQLLMDWMFLELQYHARGLEIYTQAFNTVKAIDIEIDMQDFRNKLMSTELSGRLLHRDSNNSTPVGKWSSKQF